MRIKETTAYVVSDAHHNSKTVEPDFTVDMEAQRMLVENNGGRTCLSIITSFTSLYYNSLDQ